MQAQKENNMAERRNYYRILNVQPDAPLSQIKSNYRTLLQKLRLHPDLGGQEEQAAIINEAYNILRHPEKRAVYDAELLKQHDIKSLSQGHLQQQASTITTDRHGNKRNFYRLFNIQADASAAIIKTSYQTLLKADNIPAAAIKEAYAILGNQKKRAVYDQLLQKVGHAEAVKRLLNISTNVKTELSTQATEHNDASRLNRNRLSASYGNKPYQPLITRYCHFCKTPHNENEGDDGLALCLECDSPLFPPSSLFTEQQRRDIVRIAKRDDRITFYTDWPGEQYHAAMLDMSPTGLKLQTSALLQEQQLLKIEADTFKAVGQVTHISHEYIEGKIGDDSVGIKFLTVNFDKLKGQFFSASA